MRHGLASSLVVAIAFASATATAQPTSEPPRLKGKLKGKPSQRAFGASAVRLGCSPSLELPCEGLSPYRLGLTAGHIALILPSGVGPVVVFQAAARPFAQMLESQVIATAGLKAELGDRGWVHAGVGVASQRVVRNPKPLTATETLDQPVPAVTAGIGVDLGADGRPLSFGLDIGTSVESRGAARVYQWSASMVHRF